MNIQNLFEVFCEGSEMLTEWKSESMTNERKKLMDRRTFTGVGSRDTCVSKKITFLFPEQAPRRPAPNS